MHLNTRVNYGWVAKLLLWLVAVTLFSLFGLGFWRVDLSYCDSWNKLAPHHHKSIGISLVVVMLFRVAWRCFNVRPDLSKALTQRGQVYLVVWI